MRPINGPKPRNTPNVTEAGVDVSESMRPNARGKGRPHGLAEASNDVGVPLTEKLGCGEEEQPMSTSKPCLASGCLSLACLNSLCVNCRDSA